MVAFDDGGCRGNDDGGCRGNDDGGCCGDEDNVTATTTTISASITNSNKIVKTVVSVGEGNSGIGGGDGIQSNGPVALMY